MRKPPRGFTYNAPLIPVGMFEPQVAYDHLPGIAVHLVGNLQALSARFGSDDPGHLIVDYFNNRRSPFLFDRHVKHDPLSSILR
jgi:hypothetical protein